MSKEILQELETAVSDYSKQWNSEECNGQVLLGKLHSFREFVENSQTIDSTVISRYENLCQNYPVLTTIPESQWISLVEDHCSILKTVEKKSPKSMNSQLFSWLEISANLFCQFLSRSMVLNISKQDWNSHSPYMRNKRITPGILFATSAFHRVALHLIENLMSQELLFLALFDYSLVMMNELCNTVINIYWSLKPSRTRLTQWRNDLIYFFLQIFFSFKQLFVSFHDENYTLSQDLPSMHRIQKLFAYFQILLQMICFSQEIHSKNIPFLFSFAQDLFLDSKDPNATSKTVNKESSDTGPFPLNDWKGISDLFFHHLVHQWNLFEELPLFQEIFLNHDNTPTTTVESIFSSFDMISLLENLSSEIHHHQLKRKKSHHHRRRKNNKKNQENEKEKEQGEAEDEATAEESLIFVDSNYKNEFKLHLENYRMTNKMIIFHMIIQFPCRFNVDYEPNPFASGSSIRKIIIETIHELFTDQHELEETIIREQLLKNGSSNEEEEEIAAKPFNERETLKNYISVLFSKRFEVIDCEYPQLTAEQQEVRSEIEQFFTKLE
jgi:hypothetical protein